MSVINQMLKDLDKRQEQPMAGQHSHVPQAPVKSNTPLAIIITVVATLVIVALFYLYIENQALRENNEKQEPNVTQQIPKAITQIEPSSINYAAKEQETAITETDSGTKLVPKEQLPASNDAQLTKSPDLTDNTVIDGMADDSTAAELVTSVIASDKDTESINPEQTPVVNQSATTTLSISRKQLSPSELAAKKMVQAEQAILDQNIKEAEQYFEDILIIYPQHQAARKQLAALLYGRQATQQAVNILAQGIELNPQDAELRLMQARIYVESGFQEQAYDILRPLSQVLDTEYQALLATLAQSLKQYESAKVAYTQLIKIQANQGRWYLGLAISHDSLGEYQQAYTAYNNAINTSGLSDSALSFARQRMLELGDK